jgi:YD repeat-containing protein
MGVWNYQYNALGSLTQQTDARGCQTNLTYDALNRLTQKSYNSCPSTAAVKYIYDGLMRWDEFGGSSLPAVWSSVGNVSVSGGQMHYTGSNNWSTYVQRSEKLEPRQSILVQFKVNTSTPNGGISLETGTWGTESFRR